MKNQYSTVFISHANPEDNEFASFLASKLTMQGYKIWCDLEYFRGGNGAGREKMRARKAGKDLGFKVKVQR